MFKRSVVRTVWSLLLIALILSELISCANINTQSQENTATPPPSTVAETPSEAESAAGTGELANPYGDRFSGGKFNIVVVYNDLYGRSSRDVAHGDSNDPAFFALDQVINDHVKRVESLLGVDVFVQYYNSSEAEGKKYEDLFDTNKYDPFDLMIIPQTEITDFVNNHIHVRPGHREYGEFTLLDAKGKEWNQTAPLTEYYAGVRAAALNDSNHADMQGYLMTGYVTPEYYEHIYCSLVNKQLWTEYADRIASLPSSGGYGNIYDIIDNGYWTMDLWIDISEMIKADDAGFTACPAVSSGRGLETYESVPFSYSYLGYGAQVKETIQYTGQGDTVTNVSVVNDRTVAYMEKLSRLLDLNTAENTGNDAKVLLDLGMMKDGVSLTGSEKEAYVLPLPKLSTEQKNYETGSLSPVMYLVNRADLNEEEREQQFLLSQAVLDLLAKDAYNTVFPAFWRLANGKTDETDDNEHTRELLVDGCVFDIHDGLSCGGNVRYNVCYALLDAAANIDFNKNPSQARVSAYFGSYIADWMKNYQSIPEYFNE